MAQLVRPSSADADADDSGHSKPPDFSHSDLRARIEGKRRDDQVRKREFNHLRKIRASAGLGGLGLLAPSTFQVSSGFNPEEVSTAARAHTLKKIDQIEAYMGEHLRQKRQTTQVPLSAIPESSVAAKREPPVLTQSVAGPASGPPKVAPAKAAPAPAPAAAAEDSQSSEMDLDFTGMLGEATEPTPLHVEAQPSMSSSYSESRLESQELGEGGDDPALQDAAIRFAEGDVAGAEGALLAIIQDSAADPTLADRCACALMDLYRATDQSAPFDVIAIEYAQRFGRSAPEWYSIPDLLRKAAAAHAPQAQASGGAAWTCAPLLTAQGVAQLAAQQKGAIRQMQWGQLQSIAPEAVPALTQLLTQWANQPVSLVFGDAPAFNAVLQAATVTGERDTDPAWWMLRLEALRIEGAHEDFETVALDYCITYDVSPPSWLEAVCTYSNAAQTAPETPFPEVQDSVPFTDSRFPEGPELRGDLLGDAQAVLEKLYARAHIPGEPMVIHCKRLLRVDFSAVGSMLNWLAARRSQGVEVEFVQVPRLIGVFFQLMGITEFATVVITTR